MTWIDDQTKDKQTKRKATSKVLKQASEVGVKFSKVAPTGLEGIDKLISEPFSEPTIGGIPLGRGKITLLAGNAGSGKTRLLVNLVCKILHSGGAFMYVSFEFEGEEFVGQVLQLYQHLYDTPCPLKNLYFMDYYCTPFGMGHIKIIASRAKEFIELTGSPFIAIDSVTEMAKMETLLRGVMKDLTKAFFDTTKDFAIIGVSQFRGNYDGAVAGGKGMPHKASAVILLESETVNNFNKWVFDWLPMGSLVRTISVVKTANYAHDLHRYPFTIDEAGVVHVRKEPLSITANTVVID